MQCEGNDWPYSIFLVELRDAASCYTSCLAVTGCLLSVCLCLPKFGSCHHVAVKWVVFHQLSAGKRTGKLARGKVKFVDLTSWAFSHGFTCYDAGEVFFPIALLIVLCPFYTVVPKTGSQCWRWESVRKSRREGWNFLFQWHCWLIAELCLTLLRAYRAIPEIPDMGKHVFKQTLSWFISSRVFISSTSKYFLGRQCLLFRYFLRAASWIPKKFHCIAVHVWPFRVSPGVTHVLFPERNAVMLVTDLSMWI